MRPIYPGDLHDAARAILAAPHPSQLAVAEDILRRADLADRFRKRLRRAHPTYGDGTVSAAACSLGRAPSGRHCTPEFLTALRLFLQVYLQRTDNQLP